jgi:hypothetical protein
MRSPLQIHHTEGRREERINKATLAFITSLFAKTYYTRTSTSIKIATACLYNTTNQLTNKSQLAKSEKRLKLAVQPKIAKNANLLNSASSPKVE